MPKAPAADFCHDCRMALQVFALRHAQHVEPALADPGQQELPEIPVAHFHATSWADWQAHYRFRLDRGAYRAELKPPRRADAGSVNLHTLLSTLEESEGVPGLRRFFEEVCADTPALRDRLAAEGLLREVTMDFAALRARHFPDVGA